MSEAQRANLDRLWQRLGVDPRSEGAQALEKAVAVVTLREITEGINALRAKAGVAPL